jgi:predicted dehydrogenase
MMIRTAIAGLGWWGKTLVESLDRSEVMKVVAGAEPNVTPETEAFVKARGMRLATKFDDLVGDKGIDAVILATPPSGHSAQIIALAGAGKHIFCEKPFSYSKAQAEAAAEAVRKAGVAIGIGFNRRFHPEMIDLKKRIQSGGLGELMHLECTMAVPNALFMPKTAWRAQKEEAPCGALAPLGVHAIDAFIDFAGPFDTVYCQSFRKAVDLPIDDTTSLLFRHKNGVSAYLGMMMATAGTFVISAYGSKGAVRIEGMTHLATMTSEERRTGLFGKCTFHPVKGDAEVWEAARVDVPKQCLEALGRAAAGGAAFPITLDEMVHGAAANEALIRSAATNQVEKVK